MGIYLVFKEGYPEDYAFVYAYNLDEVYENYTEYYGVDVNKHDFFESYNINRIDYICGKKIKGVIFE